MTTYNKTVTDKRDAKLLALAQEHFGVETLMGRKSDRLDFHEVSVWGMASALERAWEAGRASVLDPIAAFKDFESNGWECEDSPTGHCTYEEFGEDQCDVCGDPKERK